MTINSFKSIVMSYDYYLTIATCYFHNPNFSTECGINSITNISLNINAIVISLKPWSISKITGNKICFCWH